MLDVEDAQRGAALTGALECRRQDVPHRLLRQRGGIHHHGVQPAGLGHQHHVGLRVIRQRTVDGLRHLRGPGEKDAGDGGTPNEFCTDAGAVARQQLQRCRGTPAARSSSTARAAISGACSAGLAMTALPAASAAATWPVKIASGKFQGEMQTMMPRPEGSPASAPCLGDKALRLGCVVVQEINRFTQFCHRILERLACLAAQSANNSGACCS
jgi:hypothetical protein